MPDKKKIEKPQHIPMGKRARKEGEERSPGYNPWGVPPRQLHFTQTLQKELTKRKTFRRKNGSVFDATELELITLKVIRELRESEPLNAKLLEIVLNRLEGKPKESVDLSGQVGVVVGEDPKGQLLKRLDALLESRRAEDGDSGPES